MSKKKGKTENGETKKTYTIQGPFNVLFKKGPSGRFIEEAVAKKRFAEDAGEYKNRIGVYIFGVLRQGGSVPWYVGKTTKNFLDEVFTPKNVKAYNKALIYPGNPVVFLIVHPKLGRGRGSPAVRQISEIEDFFVKLCYEKNKSLLNAQLLPKATKWKIKGVMGTRGAADDRAKRFKKMVGLATK